MGLFSKALGLIPNVAFVKGVVAKVRGQPLEAKKQFKTATISGAVIGGAAILGATGAAPVVGRIVLGQAKTLIPKTVGGKILALTGISALTTSPILRDVIVKKLNPISTGRELGRIIEDPSKLLPKDKSKTGVKDKVVDTLKTAGLIGGVAAATVGGVVLAKKGIAKVKGLLPSTATGGLIGSRAAPTGLLPATPSITPVTQPLGAVQKEVAPTTSPISTLPPIKITNKPVINVSFRKSRKFINQQVLVKPCQMKRR